MEYPIVYREEIVGNCVLTDQGLYWELTCSCRILSDRVERLYSGETRLGVLERDGDRLRCRRRVSKASTPELPPRSGVFTLTPVREPEPWQGELLGYELSGFREGNTLLFPYAADRPCPCEPLICFFEIADGFWRLPLQPQWEQSLKTTR